MRRASRAAFIERVLTEPKFDAWTVRALSHNRIPVPREHVEIVRGSIEHPEPVERAMQDIPHVLHLATCKETPSQK
ncbi:MAG TPA: hypothetical protein VFD70_11235 [Anaerolineae bacterium]|nr:hypothetical protein [Anaerolineae bacterium]